MFNFLKTGWEKTKEFFNRSWTIFLARAETALGIVLSAIAAIDFSMFSGYMLPGTDVNWKVIGVMGGYFFLKGIVTEIARRQNTATLSDGQLMPVAVKNKDEAKKVLRVRK